MAEFIPLKIEDGQLKQFQAGDTISTAIAPGIGGAGADIALSTTAPATDQTIAAGRSAYLSDFYEIASTFFLEIGNLSVFEIG